MDAARLMGKMLTGGRDTSGSKGKPKLLARLASWVQSVHNFSLFSTCVSQLCVLQKIHVVFPPTLAGM